MTSSSDYRPSCTDEITEKMMKQKNIYDPYESVRSSYIQIISHSWRGKNDMKGHSHDKKKTNLGSFKKLCNQLLNEVTIKKTTLNNAKLK